MKGIRFALLAAVGILSASRLEAVVVDFDDLVTGGGVIAIPALYGGISWDSPEFGVYGFAQPPYNAHSNPNRALVNFETCCPVEEISFSFPDPVYFGGAWFAGSPGLDLTVNLYLGGALVHTTGVLDLSSVPTLWGSGYGGAIDQVGILSQRGFYVFDDVTYEAVPEPTTLALLGAGVAVLARRRKTAS